MKDCVGRIYSMDLYIITSKSPDHDNTFGRVFGFESSIVFIFHREYNLPAITVYGKTYGGFVWHNHGKSYYDYTKRIMV